MAAGPPLSRLVLTASSVADDLGYVALSDLAGALEDVADEYRVIGGHMVTVLAARWQLGASLYRETGDVDLGIPPVVARDQRVVDRLKSISYVQVAGNRFARGLSDIPAGMTDHVSRQPEALIDVLVPAYTSRPRENVRVGDDLYTTEVPGLDLALARPPARMALTLHRLNGSTLRCDLPFADEMSALVLKSLATGVRFKDTDIADVWRCLEIALAAGIGPQDFNRALGRDSAEVIRTLFSKRNGHAMSALAAEQRLHPDAVAVRFTRIRALIARVLGST